MAITRPVSTIFPSVHCIDAPFTLLGFDPLFWSASVKELDLQFCDSSLTGSDSELLIWKAGELTNRMPAVEKLDIYSELPEALTSPYIVRLVNGFTDLSTLTLSSEAVDSSVVEAASRLPKLEHLWAGSTASFYGKLEPLNPNLGPNSFPSLNYLVLDATLSDVIQLFENHHFPSANIQCLSLQIVLSDEHLLPMPYVPRLMTTLVQTAASMTKLELTFDIEFMFNDHSRTPCIQFASIAPSTLR